jgi:hypothetical protein
MRDATPAIKGVEKEVPVKVPIVALNRERLVIRNPGATISGFVENEPPHAEGPLPLKSRISF